jgi:hypothetical protein
VRGTHNTLTTSLAKVVVFNALLRLVENGLAVWRRNAGDELELQLVPGEVFALGDTGITRVRPPCKRTCLCTTRRRRTAQTARPASPAPGRPGAPPGTPPAARCRPTPSPTGGPLLVAQDLRQKLLRPLVARGGEEVRGDALLDDRALVPESKCLAGTRLQFRYYLRSRHRLQVRVIFRHLASSPLGIAFLSGIVTPGKCKVYD